MNTADKSVVRVNAKEEQEFEIIHSVSAHLTPKQVARLCGTNGIRVSAQVAATVWGNMKRRASSSVSVLN